MKKTFRRIYFDGIWGGAESASGPGSDLAATQRVRVVIPKLLDLLEVETLLDAPCGDMNWMSLVDLGHIQYIGVDIVPELIAENRRKFPNSGYLFLAADITRSELPKADLVLCRDCLVHLPFSDALKVISNFKKSGRYLLTTTFPGIKSNRDILTGEWRELDLELPPFNFPPAIQYEKEALTSVNPVWRKKSLGLWRLSDL